MHYVSRGLSKPPLSPNNQTSTHYELKLSVITLLISVCIGTIVSAQMGLAFFAVTIAARSVTHINKKKPPEFEVEIYAEGKHNSSSDLSLETDTNTFSSSNFGKEIWMEFPEILQGLDHLNRQSILALHADSILAPLNRGEDFRALKGKIEKFKEALKSKFHEFDYAVGVALMDSVNFYRPLLTAIFKKQNKSDAEISRLLQAAFSQKEQTSILGNSLVDLFLDGRYLLEPTGEDGGFRIYEIYERFFAFFLLRRPEESNLKIVEDRACQQFPQVIYMQGLRLLGIKNRQKVWAQILYNEGTSNERSGMQRAKEFIIHLPKNEQAKAREIRDALILKFKKEESKQSCFASQPGLDAPPPASASCSIEPGASFVFVPEDRQDGPAPFPSGEADSDSSDIEELSDNALEHQISSLEEDIRVLKKGRQEGEESEPDEVI